MSYRRYPGPVDRWLLIILGLLILILIVWLLS